ncbi:thermonuclease family protein [Sphingobium sp. Sx8-8]|uniref:thermonuclease family protein n=1 Tax=Sphingobium sp. Sx8-8 TaxID=2933617 RepID=UPI001F5AF996|nr:thermonuclease family protein [Sphingobium sp. Sx8-8]
MKRMTDKERAQRAWRYEARRAGEARLRRKRRKGPSFGVLVAGGVLTGGVLGWFGPDAVERFTRRDAVAPVASDRLSAQFGFCHTGGGTNCVVDGDTFWFQGQKVRVMDIDAPETHPPRCAEEAALGARATQRLQALMNAGPFSLESGDRDRDRYGRALRVVTRGGRSIGEMLVAEGLAREWDGARHPWC